jgi:hypothetical protein
LLQIDFKTGQGRGGFKKDKKEKKKIEKLGRRQK